MKLEWKKMSSAEVWRPAAPPVSARALIALALGVVYVVAVLYALRTKASDGGWYYSLAAIAAGASGIAQWRQALAARRAFVRRLDGRWFEINKPPVGDGSMVRFFLRYKGGIEHFESFDAAVGRVEELLDAPAAAPGEKS